MVMDIFYSVACNVKKKWAKIVGRLHHTGSNRN